MRTGFDVVLENALSVLSDLGHVTQGENDSVLNPFRVPNGSPCELLAPPPSDLCEKVGRKRWWWLVVADHCGDKVDSSPWSSSVRLSTDGHDHPPVSVGYEEGRTEKRGME